MTTALGVRSCWRPWLLAALLALLSHQGQGAAPVPAPLFLLPPVPVSVEATHYANGDGGDGIGSGGVRSLVIIPIVIFSVAFGAGVCLFAICVCRRFMKPPPSPPMAGTPQVLLAGGAAMPGVSNSPSFLQLRSAQLPLIRIPLWQQNGSSLFKQLQKGCSRIITNIINMAQPPSRRGHNSRSPFLLPSCRRRLAQA
ncbi:hypothetical protein VOLCADRAFT_89316 [Volvox carteri f. nagariensis]|uniref:Pherophorin domain-containing protein n=1 Tax=Volvox carteri f. nagariensis TaxID=3068 RepID=D8TRD9_VOLCA|nr:uncharacterized protein VOLCADRAFT_89316 [Volvox carteri f. nagariensis]EFJ49878.1 hypothetical protein VOLCADRAFT_89316 [Volvox carteri f. nagariensis]|eukprot:XP_002948943.1 hypothetical protein VOLCADRAFT_89316 [Volvox carteri f. nagariensis]